MISTLIISVLCQFRFVLNDNEISVVFAVQCYAECGYATHCLSVRL